MLVIAASVMRRLSLNRSEPAKKSGQNIPKNRCRTTIAERMAETPSELPFIRDQVVCLSHDQAARSGPRKEARSRGRVGRHARHEKPRPPLSSPGFKLLQQGPDLKLRSQSVLLF